MSDVDEEMSSCSVVFTCCNHTTKYGRRVTHHNHMTTGVDKEGLHTNEPSSRRPGSPSVREGCLSNVYLGITTSQ